MNTGIKGEGRDEDRITDVQAGIWAGRMQTNSRGRDQATAEGSLIKPGLQARVWGQDFPDSPWFVPSKGLIN